VRIQLETVFFEHSAIDMAAAIDDHALSRRVDVIRPEFGTVDVNPHATRSGVGGEAYDGYRTGLVGACADIVLLRDGENPAVPMIYRKNPPFGGTWWIMGGAVHNFRLVHHFLLFKALTEGGILKDVKNASEFYAKYDLTADDWSLGGVNVIGLMGLYRTPAEDQTGTGKVCDTINQCYLGLLDQGTEVWHDKDHDQVRWFTFKDLLEASDMHWYPRRVAMLALEAFEYAE
jgi:ADP-ribose pyrophosphatase YjhB (NUDIX family)